MTVIIKKVNDANAFFTNCVFQYVSTDAITNEIRESITFVPSYLIVLRRIDLDIKLQLAVPGNLRHREKKNDRECLPFMVICRFGFN